MSGETDGGIRISIPWRDWNVAGSEADYLTWASRPSIYSGMWPFQISVESHSICPVTGWFSPRAISPAPDDVFSWVSLQLCPFCWVFLLLRPISFGMFFHFVGPRCWELLSTSLSALSGLRAGLLRQEKTGLGTGNCGVEQTDWFGHVFSCMFL